MCKKKNVLLIYPTDPIVATESSLALMYLASSLRAAGHEPEIVEGNSGVVSQYLTDPSKPVPDFAGITCMTSQFHEILAMRDLLQASKVPVIFGGPHASAVPDSLLNAYGKLHDFVVVGEGEKTIVDIVEGRKQPGVIQGQASVDLDRLPFPARDLISRKYLTHRKTSILASRGCFGNCTFCQPTLNNIFGSGVRRRSPQNVVVEMVECFYMYDVSHFLFYDDTFLSSPQWVYDFCAAVDLLWPKSASLHFDIITRVDGIYRPIMERLKSVGLNRVSLGFERGDQESLNKLQKGITLEQSRKAAEICHSLGILIHGFFILGVPGETREKIQALKDFIKELDPETFFVAILTPMPATQLYNQVKREGLLLKDWGQMDIMGNLNIAADVTSDEAAIQLQIPFGEVIQARSEILRAYYLRKLRDPVFVWRFLRTHSWRYALAVTRKYLGGSGYA